MCGDTLPSKASLSSQHICNSLCFPPSACGWVWKRWICSPRVTEVVQIRHFNSSSSCTPNWPWETGSGQGQSVVTPYSARGDCVCLCIMGRDSGSRLWAPLKGKCCCQLTPVRRGLWSAPAPQRPTSHTPLKHFLFSSPSAATFHLPWERSSPRWVVQWLIEQHHSEVTVQVLKHQSPRSPHGRKQSKLRHTEPVSDWAGIPLLRARNEEQAFRNKIKRSWLLNRRRWLFQVWCRRETGKEMGVKPKSKAAGISNRSKWKEIGRGEVCYFFPALLTKQGNFSIPYNKNWMVLENIYFLICDNFM